MVYERVAAVDVAKASGVACLRVPDPARPGRFASQIWDHVPATGRRSPSWAGSCCEHQVQVVTLESHQ